MLLALLASLADEVALHGAESLAGPADDHELADLHHQSAHHYASRPPPTRTGNEAEEAVAVVVQQLVQEVEEAAHEAHVAGGGVTRGELLQVRRREGDHLVIGGEETEDEKEVGVQHIIQSPDHIGRVVDHEVGGDHLRHVLLVRPLLVEVTLLLCVMEGYEEIRDQDQRRSKSRTRPSAQRDGGFRSIPHAPTMLFTRTRAITEPRNTFSRQLPTATRRREARASRMKRIRRNYRTGGGKYGIQPNLPQTSGRTASSSPHTSNHEQLTRKELSARRNRSC